ncbi:hypothetical protein BHM03_00053219 [Ensete ventricosum]|nr:hypothetical protein BHM03_00053219 [Ensete ventricosum]
MTVESVKEKLWKKCGTAVDSMVLELFDDAGSKVCDLSDATRPFGFYSPQDGSAGLLSFYFAPDSCSSLVLLFLFVASGCRLVSLHHIGMLWI